MDCLCGWLLLESLCPRVSVSRGVERVELGLLMGNEPLCVPAQGLSTKIQGSVVACSLWSCPLCAPPVSTAT